MEIEVEGSARGEAMAIAQDIEIGRGRVVLVAGHEEIDLADRGRAVMPRLVAEMRVGRDAVYLDAHLLECRIDAGQILEFGRADEGEVGRIEEEDRAFAAYAGDGAGHELALLLRLRAEWPQGFDDLLYEIISSSG